MESPSRSLSVSQTASPKRGPQPTQLQLLEGALALAPFAFFTIRIRLARHSGSQLAVLPVYRPCLESTPKRWACYGSFPVPLRQRELRKAARFQCGRGSLVPEREAIDVEREVNRVDLRGRVSGCLLAARAGSRHIPGLRSPASNKQGSMQEGPKVAEESAL